MQPRDFSALVPLGNALLAYWKGDESTEIIQEYRSGDRKIIPAAVFFRSPKDFYQTEKVTKYCYGHILVVGAGTGVHALELERQGYKTTSLDVVNQAVQIMRERGVKDIRQCDFFEFSGELFDTILMLGHNIGICERVNRINVLLQKCKSLLAPRGQLLVNSVAEPESYNIKNKYEYPGEQVFRLSHKGQTGPWMNWLHVDYETLSRKAVESSWSIEKLIEAKNGEFLAKLKPI